MSKRNRQRKTKGLLFPLLSSQIDADVMSPSQPDVQSLNLKSSAYATFPLKPIAELGPEPSVIAAFGPATPSPGVSLLTAFFIAPLTPPLGWSTLLGWYVSASISGLVAGSRADGSPGRRFAHRMTFNQDCKGVSSLQLKQNRKDTEFGLKSSLPKR